MTRVIHRYIRRLIAWLNTPSDEEQAAADRDRRMARLSWCINAPPRPEYYAARSAAELDEMAADVQAMIDRKTFPPEGAGRHLVEIRKRHAELAGRVAA